MSTLATERTLGNLAVAASGHKGLLRFITAGSVDDGKSTMIGRLLHDIRSVYEDQLLSIQKSRINRADGPIDFSLLTDGLRAEREQGITIDVAYRYFSTWKRKFIIADTPGHEQYTRNMVTGASTADAAVILIDARKGLLTQSRRHIYIASLLGIRHVIAAVNKMDLVDYRAEVFSSIAHDFAGLAQRLNISHTYAVPISALKGDGIVSRGEKMPWFSGPPLLEYLEDLPVKGEEQGQPLRLSIQCVIRPNSHFRGFAGQIASGRLERGAKVIALPSRMQTRVKSIVTLDGELASAGAGKSVTFTLEDEIDLSRGDLLAEESGLPRVSRTFRSNLVWLNLSPSRPAEEYLLKHTTRIVRARFLRIVQRVDVNTFEFSPAPALHMNDIASVDIQTTQPLFFDSYLQNRATGSFILIDPITNATVAAGMIQDDLGEGSVIDPADAERSLTTNKNTDQKLHELKKVSAAVWISGGRSLAEHLEERILQEGWKAQRVSALEFNPVELKAVAKLLRRTGVLAIIDDPDDELELRRAITTMFGPRSVLVVDGSTSSSKLLLTVMHWLRDLPQYETKESRHV